MTTNTVVASTIWTVFLLAATLTETVFFFLFKKQTKESVRHRRHRRSLEKRSQFQLRSGRSSDNGLSQCPRLVLGSSRGVNEVQSLI
ncbi:hypothetical protein KIN20_012056 [Parelaphostrongylus tenuis]|uniref:Uncharacterized protein n=1 Tax=Parelaphostrongylus tenuis TaxID=148309 RepID=A0AAD5QLK3_PARTN|nr:hypothetical protein KIN20_012056 [Parelaphostrongylus tenuis]